MPEMEAIEKKINAVRLTLSGFPRRAACRTAEKRFGIYLARFIRTPFDLRYRIPEPPDDTPICRPSTNQLVHIALEKATA
jgi:hypothetical protein